MLAYNRGRQYRNDYARFDRFNTRTNGRKLTPCKTKSANQHGISGPASEWTLRKGKQEKLVLAIEMSFRTFSFGYRGARTPAGRGRRRLREGCRTRRQIPWLPARVDPRSQTTPPSEAVTPLDGLVFAQRGGGDNSSSQEAQQVYVGNGEDGVATYVVFKLLLAAGGL